MNESIGASIQPALAGGVLIGLGTILMLLGPGRVAGVSGIFFSVLAGPRVRARSLFLIGLLGSAVIATLAGIFDAAALIRDPHWPKLVLAGLLVGAGTQLGAGCTSGHAVCGVANASGRSIVATVIFMGVAALVVALGFGGLS